MRQDHGYFREHSDAWVKRLDYKEAGPQLLMQAFLQRIVNCGGRLSREYALGRKCTDLFIEWPLDEKKGFYGAVQKVAEAAPPPAGLFRGQHLLSPELQK